jgi:hypothetical protein
VCGSVNVLLSPTHAHDYVILLPLRTRVYGSVKVLLSPTHAHDYVILLPLRTRVCDRVAVASSSSTDKGTVVITFGTKAVHVSIMKLVRIVWFCTCFCS